MQNSTEGQQAQVKSARTSEKRRAALSGQVAVKTSRGVGKKARALRAPTMRVIAAARKALERQHPMTLRQCHYRLIPATTRDAVLENEDKDYKRLSAALRDARLRGMIPWDWMIDTVRVPHSLAMWDAPGDFLEYCARLYRRDIWPYQPLYLEAWLEKDALARIFVQELTKYRVTLNVGRGFDGWSSIYEASQRYKRLGSDMDRSVVILYFGDFDPSGECMPESLAKRFALLDCHPRIIKCAVNADDIANYNLPHDFAKTEDKRSKKFVEKNGDRCVELDALPIDILRAKIREACEYLMDMDALRAVEEFEEEERGELRAGLLELRDKLRG